MPTPSPIIAASTGAIDVIGVTDENTVMDISPNISPATALSSGATIASTAMKAIERMISAARSPRPSEMSCPAPAASAAGAPE